MSWTPVSLSRGVASPAKSLKVVAPVALVDAEEEEGAPSPVPAPVPLSGPTPSQSGGIRRKGSRPALPIKLTNAAGDEEEEEDEAKRGPPLTLFQKAMQLAGMEAAADAAAALVPPADPDEVKSTLVSVQAYWSHMAKKHNDYYMVILSPRRSFCVCVAVLHRSSNSHPRCVCSTSTPCRRRTVSSAPWGE